MNLLETVLKLIFFPKLNKFRSIKQQLSVAAASSILLYEKSHESAFWTPSQLSQHWVLFGPQSKVNPQSFSYAIKTGRFDHSMIGLPFRILVYTPLIPSNPSETSTATVIAEKPKYIEPIPASSINSSLRGKASLSTTYLMTKSLQKIRTETRLSFLLGQNMEPK